MATNAKFSYTATGTDTYPITFDFDLDEEVVVKVDKVLQNQGVEYNVAGTDIVFTAGNIPAAPAAIQGERETSNTTDNVFADKATIDSAAIDEMYLQLLRLIQENAQLSITDLYDLIGVTPTDATPHIQWNDTTKLFEVVQLDTTDIVEASPNNYMTDDERTKLAGIEDGAEVNPDVVSQAEAEAGSSTEERIWTAQRVNQAIQALSPSGANGVTAAGTLDLDKLTVGNGVKGLVTTTIDKADVVTAAANVAANAVPVGDGSKGLVGSDVEIDGGDVSGVDKINFNTGGSATDEGDLAYDSAEGTLNFKNFETDATLNIGQENWVKGRNNTGSTITNGMAVYISGSVGQNPTFGLADASDISTLPSIGLATHNIGNNTNGFATSQGLVNDINTSSYSEGDILWISATTAGELTATKPTHPNIPIAVGICTNSHVSQGAIYVNPRVGILGLQAVYDSSTNGDILTDATIGPVCLQEDTGDDTADVFCTRNNAGTMTSSIQGDGTITSTNLLDLSASGAGNIQFPATQNPSADANTLDDYEEGTFTPTLQDNSLSDGEGQTYITQVGHYTKMGRVVYFIINLNVDSDGTLSGSHRARVAGLPFTSSTATELNTSCTIGRVKDFALPSGGDGVGGFIFPNDTTIGLLKYTGTGGSNDLTISEFSEGIINITGFYEID